jgi:CheY-like chemotaxis protein
MPPVVVVENERPLQKLLRWALEEEGLPVETVAPEDAPRCVDVLIFVINAQIPLAERVTIAEAAHAIGARVIDLLAPDEPAPPAYADAVVPSPYRASDVVRAIARLRMS